MMFHRPNPKREERKPLTITSLDDGEDTNTPRKSRDDTGHTHKSASKMFSKPSSEQRGKVSAPSKTQDKRGSPHDKGAKRSAKPMTRNRIHNITEYYLAQRDASTGMLRDMLHRRAYSWLKNLNNEERATATIDFEQEVERKIAELVSAGLVDDARFARQKVRSMRSSGKGARKIALELSKKGITQQDVADAIAEIDAETINVDDEYTSAAEMELLAAETLAQKKKIGPYRRQEMPSTYDEQSKIWRREAGILARAGYGLDVIRNILDREPEAPDD